MIGASALGFKTALVVEDDDAWGDMAENRLNATSKGVIVERCKTLQEALKRVSAKKYDLIVTDLAFPQGKLEPGTRSAIDLFFTQHPTQYGEGGFLISHMRESGVTRNTTTPVLVFSMEAERMGKNEEFMMQIQNCLWVQKKNISRMDDMQREQAQAVIQDHLSNALFLLSKSPKQPGI